MNTNPTMNTNQRVRRGLSSVLAMIYLSLLAALAVGFYTAVDMSGNLADNEQYINRSQTSAESGLAFARAQIAQLSLPNTTTAGTLIAATKTALDTQLSSWGSGNLPNLVTFEGNPAVAIPAQPGGWSWSGSGALPANTQFMTTDGTGGQTLILISQSGTSMNLQVQTVGQNANARVTPIKRGLQLTFNSGQTTGAFNPIFNYGMVSYGQVAMSAPVTVKGSGSGPSSVNIMSVTPNGTTPYNVNIPVPPNPLPVYGVSGSIYWTNNTPETGVNSPSWDSFRVDTSNGANGYLPSSGHYPTYAVGNMATPSAPTFNTASFNSGLTVQSPGSGTTSLTNAILPAGTYIFNQPITITGTLYLENNVNLVFNNTVTVNGSIVQDNDTTPGPANNPNNTIVFNDNTNLNSSVTQTSSSTTPFLLTPNAQVTFNEPVSCTGPIVAGSLAFAGPGVIYQNGVPVSTPDAITGPVIDTGTILTGSGSNTTAAPMTLGVSSTVKVVNPAGTGFKGTQNIMGNFTFLTPATDYTEVGQ